MTNAYDTFGPREPGRFEAHHVLVECREGPFNGCLRCSFVVVTHDFQS